MGNDGALALRRKDIVKDKTESKDGAKESKQVTEADRWTKCSLSGEKLEEPIVSDEFGRLYNKEAVLEWLLSGEENPSMKHVTSIKDVADLRLEWKDGRWVCPISNKDVLKEFGSGKFMYFAECGHITAESALKNVLSDMCLQCEEPVNVDYAVVINPQPTDMRKLEVRMEKLAADGLTHSLRKMKRKKESKSKDSSSSKRKKT